VSRIWIEHCEGDPRNVYPNNFRAISMFRDPVAPKRFTDDELLEHLAWRCGSPQAPDVLDPEGFLFGAVWYDLEEK
jgi:hypothetical protein